MTELIADTPMTVALMPDRIAARPVGLVIVKAAFDLHHSRMATLAEKQPSLGGDAFVDDDPRSALAAATDFVPIKPSGELLVRGMCRPPARSTVSAVAIQAGPIQKAVGVFGDRVWKRGIMGLRPSDPEPFDAIPLSFDRAFGGAGFDLNPHGRGLDRSGPLPNLESIQRPLASVDDRPMPNALGPLAPTLGQRRRFAGTYDASWQRDRFPDWPTDFDIRYFHSAPADQRNRGYWTGHEEIALKNVCPGAPFVRTKLPGIVAHAFVRREGPLQPLGLLLDTITLDGEAQQAVLTWRGSTELFSGELDELSEVFVFHALGGMPATPGHAEERLAATKVVMRLTAAGFKPRLPQQGLTMATMVLIKHAARSGLDGPSLKDATALAEGTLAMAPPVAAPSIAAPAPARPSASPAAPRVSASKAPSPPAAPVEPTVATGNDLVKLLESLGLTAPEGLAELPLKAPEPTSEEELFAKLTKMLEDGLKRLPEAAKAHLPIDVSEQDLFAQLDAILQERAQQIPKWSPDELRAAMSKAGARPDAIDDLEQAIDSAGMLDRGDGTPAAPEAPVTASAPSEAAQTPSPAGTTPTDAGPTPTAPPPGAPLDAVAAPDEPPIDGAGATDAPPAGDAPASPGSLPDQSATDVLVAAAAAGTPASGDFSGADASGLDLSGLNAAGAVLARANLKGTNLAGATLIGARLAGANLDGANLDGANLSKADLTGASLKGASLRGATLAGAALDAADLSSVDATEANLTAVTATTTSLAGATLENAVLARADMTDADLSNVRGNGASLEDAVLVRADARGAVLRNANLRGLRARRGAKLDGADLRGSDAQRARFGESELGGANLSFCDLRRADFSGATLDDATLISSNCRSARFDGARLVRAALSSSDLFRASFRGASLTKADVRGASLHAAELLEADLSGARLDGADLSGTKARGRA